MQPRLAALLALSGVLVAGAAAALVNAQVLNSSSPSAGVAEAAAPVVTAPVVSSPAAPAPTAAVVPVVVATSVVPTASQAAYQVGDAGLITLDTTGGVLAIVAVTPNAGWTVVRADQPDGDSVTVTLQRGTVAVTFTANDLFGVISTSVDSRDLAPAGSSSASGTVGGSGSAPGATYADDENDDSSSWQSESGEHESDQDDD